MPTPEIDATVPVPAKVGAAAETKKPLVAMAELADPDSLETKVTEHAAESLPKWRLEQEQQRTRREQDLSQQIAATQSAGDVLQVFEAELAKPTSQKSAFQERARGVADESEELLSMDAIAAPKSDAAAAVKPKAQPVSPPPKAEPPKVEPKAELPKLEPPKLELAKAESVPTLTEPASVTQPLAALTLLESPVEPPMQLGLLGNDPLPPKDDSPQLELLPDAVGQSR